MADALDHILLQIRDADAELATCEPQAMNWSARCETAARVIVPWVQAEASGLKGYVERVLNAPARLRQLWEQLRDQSNLVDTVIQPFEQALSDTGVLVNSVTGKIVSSLVMAHLQARFANSDLRPNGRSGYPDLWL